MFIMVRRAGLLIILSLVSIANFSCGDDSPSSPGPIGAPPGTFQTIMGTGSYESGHAVRQTPDGGYLLVGSMGGGFQDVLMAIKTDATGTPTLENYLDEFDYIRTAAPADDGGMVVLSNRGYLRLTKFNADGQLAWRETLSGFNSQSLCAMTPLAGGGYAVVGGTGDGPFSIEPHRLVRTNPFGVVTAEVLMAESNRNFWAMDELLGGDLLLAGDFRNDANDSQDIFLQRLNPSGVEIWDRTHGESGTDYVRDLDALQDGGSFMTGEWSDNTFLMKLDEDGRQLWRKSIDGSITDVTALPDRGAVLSGSETMDALMVRVDQSGRTRWSKSFGRQSGDAGVGVATADDGFVMVGLSIDPEASDNDVLLIRTDGFGRTSPLNDRSDCPEPQEPPPAPPVLPPVPRDWFLARGPANSSSFEAFATTSTGDVLGVSNRFVYKLVGEEWTILDTQAPNLLFEISAVEDDYIVASGINHTLYHFDGIQWTSYPSNAPHFSYQVLGSIWGSSRNDIFAVGNEGAIVHFDGTSWGPMASGVNRNILGVWGSAPNDVWAVVQSGAILHFNGTEWSSAYEHDGELRDVWGSAADDVYVVGLGGAMIHYDGSVWTPQTVTTAHLLDIAGRNSGDIYVVGEFGSQGVILHFDGVTWADDFTVIPGDPPLQAVAVDQGNRVFASRGDLDIRVHWFDGSHWKESKPLLPDLNSVWAYSNDYAIAVGDEGTILLWNGVSWDQMQSNSVAPFSAVYGFAPNDVYAGAKDGTVQHFDGISWSALDTPTWYVSDIWGSSPTDVYAAGVHTSHYDGTRWRDATPKGNETLWGINGFRNDDIYAVYATKVWHFDGCEWKVIHTVSGNLRSVWCQPGPLVYAVGDAGLVVRFDGSTWTTLSTSTNEYFSSTWGRSAGDIFVVGNSVFAGYYVNFQYDGQAWTKPPLQSAFALRDVHGVDDGTLFLVGTGGIIVRAVPEVVP